LRNFAPGTHKNLDSDQVFLLTHQRKVLAARREYMRAQTKSHWRQPMRAKQWMTCASIAAIGVFLSCEPVLAQQINGVAGSPSATTTIEGGQLPPPPQKFEGKIERNAAQSTPYWPMRVVPPKGAPNILLIMTDDTGFGVTSTFGGVVPTPTLDRIAANGLRYTNFNSTALCSPTRAAIITGRNHHSMGFGVVAEQSTGYPGYNSFMPGTSRPSVES
jgi:hypothetical protein